VDNDIRLVKFLSTYAGVSRRAAGDLVKNGCVTVDGKTVTEPGLRVTPENRVTLNGTPVKAQQRKYYIMLNKPRGYVSTNADPHADKKAVDLIVLPDAPRLFSAGRLDKESEGMLLFSNDGEYVATLTHPRNEILKTYIIQLQRELTSAEISKILNGIEDDGEFLHALELNALGNRRYSIILNEGRKREIRRMTAAVGSPTLRLKRVKTGKLELGNLAAGQWRELTFEEVQASLQPGL
jgi:23S rRNA pseudouridine2605 synthase